MAGQRVVSRRIPSGAAAAAFATTADATTTTTTAKHSSSQSRSQSPLKQQNPFKRKKRNCWHSHSSVATKLILLGSFCYGLVWMAKVHRLPETAIGSHDGRIHSNTTNGISRSDDSNSQPGDLDLRPDYLTDDGRNDEDDEDEEETSSSEEVEAAKDAFEDEEEEEEAYDNEEGDQEEEEYANPETDEEGQGEEEKVRLRSPSRRDHKGQQEPPQQYNHKIPRILIFTHYKNLLELERDHEHEHEIEIEIENKHKQYNTDNAAAPGANNNAYQNNLTPDKLEELTLAANVRHSIDVHKKNHRSAATFNDKDEKEDNDVKVLFWTDDDCIQSLERTRPKLVSYFKSETEGMYKADICRGTALLEHGGFYLDVDVGVRHDLWKDVRPQTEFVTARVHQASNWVGKGFFQAVLGASPNSPILQRYLELFEEHYDGTHRVSKGPLGVLLLKRAWDQVNEELEHQKASTIPTELYQELLFQENGPLDSGGNKGVLSPAPTWGKRRACHFIVAGIANDPSNIEMVLERNNNNSNSDNESVGNKEETKKKKGAIGLQIPVLSRIPGSRMCVSDPKDTQDTAAGGGGSKMYNTTQMMESMKWWERS